MPERSTNRRGTSRRRASSPPARRPARRTQQERRTTTIGKLLDATCDELVQSGYGGATVARIAARAGVSQGALFRHFATREALMVAAAAHVNDRMLADFERAFLELPQDTNPVLRAIRLVRAHRERRAHRAFHELMVASLTDPALAAALRPTFRKHRGMIERLARRLLPDIAEALGPRFDTAVDVILAAFDGEWMHAAAFTPPRPDDGRPELLAEAFTLLAREAQRRGRAR